MNRQPIYNERRFYRYPMFRVAAILDDAEDTRTALDALERAGVDIAKVNLLTGHEGARVLDRTGRKHGWGARLLRLLQRGAYEGDALEAHERALEEGRNVIFVPVSGDEESFRIVEILRAAGGHYVLHFHPWHVALP
jgi:ATP phosphoribosyltransferase regulatory subunit HisZ